MKKLKILLGIAFMGFLSACNTNPPKVDSVSQDPGQYPKNYQEIVERYLDRILKDPTSKKIEWLNKPRPIAYSLKSFLSDAVVIPGYGVCAFVNAKNSFGGYAGSKLVLFLIKNDSVVRSSIPSTEEWIPERATIDTCKAIRE